MGISTTPALSWPEQWNGNCRRARWRAVGFSLLTVAFFATFVGLYQPGAYEGAFLAAGLGAYTLMEAVTSWIRSNLDLRRSTDRIFLQEQRGGISIPAHKLYKTSYHIATVGLLLISAAFVYTGFTGAYDGPERRAFTYYLLAFTIFPALGLWMAARLSSRLLFRLRGPRMGVRVTPSGVAQTTLWGEAELEWNDIESIIITKGAAFTLWRHRKKAGSRFLVILRPTGRARRRMKGHFPYLPVTDWLFVRLRAAIIEVAELDVYPPVIPHLLTFYFEHRELREELGTEKALERIRTGNFVA